MTPLEKLVVDELINYAIVNSQYYHRQHVLHVDYWHFQFYDQFIRKVKTSWFFGGEPIVIAETPPFEFDEMKVRIQYGNDMTLFTVRTQEYHDRVKGLGV